ncbi:MAG: hypothetical protein WC076_13860, partial [Terrimicrobiaceae bacterium]
MDELAACITIGFPAKMQTFAMINGTATHAIRSNIVILIPLLHSANDAGEPPPSGGRLDPLVRIDHVFTRSHEDHKVNSVFRSGS